MFKLWLQLLNRFFFTLVEDLVSFRHKLIVIVVLLCFLTIKDATTFGIAAGMLTIIISYYYKLRQDSSQSNHNDHKGSLLDREEK